MPRDNRAALLEGARTCLDRQGYARTRARDVADAAGVSLAAIGYHFGSTDALLVQALTAGMQEWSDGLDARLDGLGAGADGDRAAARWDAVVASFDGYRGVLAASYELLARADEAPESATVVAGVLESARRRFAARMHDVDAATEPERAARVGAAGYAVVSGLIVQWLVQPEALPAGAELAAGLREVAGTA